ACSLQSRQRVSSTNEIGIDPSRDRRRRLPARRLLVGAVGGRVARLRKRRGLPRCGGARRMEPRRAAVRPCPRGGPPQRASRGGGLPPLALVLSNAAIGLISLVSQDYRCAR